MPLINKPSFLNLITALAAEGFDPAVMMENPIAAAQLNPYVGMGNPDSDILMVGTEKALSVVNPAHAAILVHELYLNVSHWNDLIVNHNHLTHPFDPNLLARFAPFTEFNPFSPLLFEITRQLVLGHHGHTYYGLERLLMQYEAINGLAPTNVMENINFHDSSFSRCFITEISARPAVNLNQAKFNLAHFFTGNRYHYMTAQAAAFYQSFRTVVMYAGKNAKYVGNAGTQNRLQIIRIFNTNLTHADIHILPDHVYYDNGTGARVILCRHLSSGFGGAIPHNVALSIL